MIYFYSGTPGSGKSLNVAKDIYQKLVYRKQNVITNMQINFDYIRTNHFIVFLNKTLGTKFNPIKKTGKLYYVSFDKLTVDFLYKYAMKFHQVGKEGQTLLILDEAQIKFSPNSVKLHTQQDPYFRYKWLDFFTQHRHLGYNIILTSQFDRLIDPQIRCLFEYNHIHRKVNNFGVGWLFSLLGISLFICVQYWYGVQVKTGVSFFTYSKKYSKIYNSYKRFSELQKGVDKDVKKIASRKKQKSA